MSMLATAPPPLPPLPKPRSYKPPKTDTDTGLSCSRSIARLARSGQLSSAASAFSSMFSDVPPNEITFLTLISSCADFPSSPSSLPFGLLLHSLLIKLYGPSRLSTPLSTALLHLYSAHSLPSSSVLLFDQIKIKNSFAYNAMLSAYLRNHNLPLALSFFRSVPLPFRDKYTYTLLLNSLPPLRSLHLFQEILANTSVRPDYVMLVSLLSSCASLGALSQGVWIHLFSQRHNHISNVRLINSLVDMYSRCGRVDLAHQVFLGTCNRTIVTWNSIIGGFAMNGRSVEALQHFATMRDEGGFEPDGVSYTGALTACSHAGMVEEGLALYGRMRREGKVRMRMEHYGCVVDMLARSGRLEEAMRVVESMREVNEVVLGSLLAACRVHGDVALAEKVMGYLVELEPETKSKYVTMSNVYASAGKWDGAGKARNAMKCLGVKKSPGFSMIEVDGRFHEFVAADRTHLKTRSIYDMLDFMFFDMNLRRVEV